LQTTFVTIQLPVVSGNFALVVGCLAGCIASVFGENMAGSVSDRVSAYT